MKKRTNLDALEYHEQLLILLKILFWTWKEEEKNWLDNSLF